MNSTTKSNREGNMKTKARQHMNIEEMEKLRSHANTEDSPPQAQASGNTIDELGEVTTASHHGNDKGKENEQREEESLSSLSLSNICSDSKGLEKVDQQYSMQDPSLGKELQKAHHETMKTLKTIKNDENRQAIRKSPTAGSKEYRQDYDTLLESQSSSSFSLEPVDPAKIISAVENKTLKCIAAVCAACYLCGRFNFGILFTVIALLIFTYTRKKTRVDLGWEFTQHKDIPSLYTSEGESTEWLNFIVEKIWRSIDPDFFAFVEVFLQDTLKTVIPGFIKSIKVTGLDIGVQAPRIQSIRIFPSLPGQSEESIFGEASFSFHAHPSASFDIYCDSEAKSPSIALQFDLGVHAPMDIRAELVAFSGKLRFKILTSPEVPFVSEMTIAFTSMPTIETAIMPLTQHVNIMHLPMIKILMNQAISLGFNEFIDPKSMTLDIHALLCTAAIDVRAIGVIKVEVREAIRRKTKSLQEMKDSYVTLSLSNQPHKTMSSTRVLNNDKDPRWDEILYVLVNKDDILANTKVDIKVWDADKVKFDDLWGSTSISVKECVLGQVDDLGNVSDWTKEERVVFDGWTPIDKKSEEKSKVKLNYKLSFHPKYTASKIKPLHKENTKTHEKTPEKSLSEDVNPMHANGILSVQIHQAIDLAIEHQETLEVDKKKHPYSPNQVVSPYAVLYINDTKVLRTLTKAKNPSPHWNTVLERFITDYESTSILISIKNSISFENNPVLGTKKMALYDLLKDQKGNFKRVRQWVLLENGIGFGKVLITVKYKPVKLAIPRELQGSDVGTLVMDYLDLRDLRPPFDQSYINSTKAVLALNVDPTLRQRLKSPHLKERRHNKDRDQETHYGWWHQAVYFPLSMRYHTALYVHVLQGKLTHTTATGRLWLKNIPDNEWQEVVLGLHSHCPEQSKEANRNEDDWETRGDRGHIALRMKIIPGISPLHTQLHSYKRDMLGADAFSNDALRAEAQHWIQEQSQENESGSSSNLKGVVQEELKKREDVESSDLSNATSYDEQGVALEGDCEASEEERYVHEMHRLSKPTKIRKMSVVRKLIWAADKAKNKVDLIQDGFNSEARANRSVTKET
ncbi:hypothetical protein BDF14DRAFT_1861374 [Spinellus fusiger]|nr:hypothetical protein BDF14DRAFT_1861374 [Spinellus fusiger]